MLGLLWDKNMDDIQNQRLLFDMDCNICNKRSTCEWVDSQQCCRSITDKLRFELKNNKKHREIVSKITITTEYFYQEHGITKSV
jgi:hypothetical protein